MLGGYSLCYVFTDVHELLLRKYLLRVSTFYIELTLMKIRKLAQVYAVNMNIILLLAGQNMNGQENYLSCHPLLSLTSHEAPSLICIKSLNQHNMGSFPTTTLGS